MITAMESQLEEEKTDLTNKENRHKECVKKVSDLEQAINEHGRDLETRLQTVEKKIKSTKKEMATASKLLKVLCVQSYLFS
jgi:predicted  nucleic acid-binding Zn-ribbon protein